MCLLTISQPGCLCHPNVEGPSSEPLNCPKDPTPRSHRPGDRYSPSVLARRESRKALGISLAPASQDKFFLTNREVPAQLVSARQTILDDHRPLPGTR